VAGYLRSWLSGKRGAVEPATWAAYRFHVESCLIPLLGHLPLGGLRPDDVRRSLAALARPPYSLGPRTIHHVHVRLRQALTQAVRDGILVRDAAAVVDGPRVPRGEVRVLSAEEVRRLLAVAKGEWHTLWLVALHTRMRLGELLGLPWGAVTWDVGDGSGEGAVSVRQVLAAGERGDYTVRPYPKSRSGVRTIRVPADVVDELRAHQEWQRRQEAAAGRWEDSRGLVFLTRWGTPHLPSNVLRALKRDAAQAGVPAASPGDVHPHLLRHTFASSLLLAGRPITEVAYLLGHASAATTLGIYAHWVRQGTTGAAAALGTLYRSAPAPTSAAAPDTDAAGEDAPHRERPSAAGSGP
jgi:integrase